MRYGGLCPCLAPAPPMKHLVKLRCRLEAATEGAGKVSTTAFTLRGFRCDRAIAARFGRRKRHSRANARMMAKEEFNDGTGENQKHRGTNHSCEAVAGREPGLVAGGRDG